MGYWYIRAEISRVKNTEGIFSKETRTKPKMISGKIIGLGVSGFYGSHPCYIVATQEGKNPKTEEVLLHSEHTDYARHKILELKYRKG